MRSGWYLPHFLVCGCGYCWFYQTLFYKIKKKNIVFIFWDPCSRRSCLFDILRILLNILNCKLCVVYIHNISFKCLSKPFKTQMQHDQSIASDVIIRCSCKANTRDRTTMRKLFALNCPDVAFLCHLNWWPFWQYISLKNLSSWTEIRESN